MPENDAAEGPSHDDPVAVVDSYLRDGGSVCVPALRAARVHQIDYVVLPGTDMQEPVYAALREFLKANGLDRGNPARKAACILIDGTPDITPVQQRNRALAIQEEIQVAIARLNAAVFTADRWHRSSVRKQIAAHDFSGVHGGQCRGQDIIRFAMGPHYDATHRRYMPGYLAVPVTTGTDAGWYHQNMPEDVRQTYLAITRRSGEMLTTMAYYEDVDPT